MATDTTQTTRTKAVTVASLRKRMLEQRDAALALVAVARRNTNDSDEWDAAIAAVEKAYSP